jgi:hypothetical protein
MQLASDPLQPEGEEHEARAYRPEKERERDDDDAADHPQEHSAR